MRWLHYQFTLFSVSRALEIFVLQKYSDVEVGRLDIEISFLLIEQLLTENPRSE